MDARAPSASHPTSSALRVPRTVAAARPPATASSTRKLDALPSDKTPRPPWQKAALAPPVPAVPRRLDGLWPARSQVQFIEAGLCITNFFGAKDLAALRTARVTHVLVCAGELPTVFPQHFAYRRLSQLYDGPSQTLAPALLAALPWIGQAIEQGGCVLLHCAAGVSRSGAVAVAYVMWHRGLSADAALQVVRAVRPIVTPNDDFMAQLRLLDVSSLGPPPQAGGPRGLTNSP